LWATIGHSFNPPSGSTSISSRVKNYYDSMLAAFDEVRGAKGEGGGRQGARRVGVGGGGRARGIAAICRGHMGLGWRQGWCW